jgi:hypothetical protein
MQTSRNIGLQKSSEETAIEVVSNDRLPDIITRPVRRRSVTRLHRNDDLPDDRCGLCGIQWLWLRLTQHENIDARSSSMPGD